MKRWGITEKSRSSIPICLIEKSQLNPWLEKQNKDIQKWVESLGFVANTGQVCLIGGTTGQIHKVLVGFDPHNSFGSCGDLKQQLPPGYYRFSSDELSEAYEIKATVAWACGAYKYDQYKSAKFKDNGSVLVLNNKIGTGYAKKLIEATYLIRDLINTPAADMGPEALAEAALEVANTHNAKAKHIIGDDLLKKNFPAIYAVGKAAEQAPRLVDFSWGDKSHPKITLVGKGVCFDTGGLDLKPASSMSLMKKDMGGAAHILGLAKMIMMSELPVRLRVLLPIVENAIGSRAFRPQDVIKTRKGISVEIGNTDAEGRLILCDALTAACEDNPDLIVDCATLTGAARVALGADIPALFSQDNEIARRLMEWGEKEEDPVWQLPLHMPYKPQLASYIADMNNISKGGFGGSITAALFLHEFILPHIPWLHLDMYAWNASQRPGRPEGGEAMGLRALYRFIEETYESLV